MDDIKIGFLGISIPFEHRASLDNFEILKVRPEIAIAGSVIDRTTYCRINENYQYWRKKLEACHNKLIVFYLTKEMQYICRAMGEAQTITNYDICPIINESCFENCQGSGVYFSGENGTAVQNLYKFLEKHFHFQVYFNDQKGKILFTTKNKEHNLGGIYRDKNNNIYLFLPDFNRPLNDKDFEPKYDYLLKEIYLELFAGDKTDQEEPEWVKNNSDYLSEIEKEEQNKISEMQKKIDEAQAAINQSCELIKKEQTLKKLLYAQSHALEESILEALQIIGFNNPHNYRTDNFEIDIICDEKDNPGILLIGEAEGTTKKTVNNKKLHQLIAHELTYIEENDTQTESLKIVKVLFGNAFADIPPEQRENYFGPHVYKISKMHKVKLVQTPDLFMVALHIKNTNDKEYAQKCFDSFFDGKEGIINFPKP